MKVVVVGTGYVGLVQSACMAELGNEVTGVDIDPKKIELLLKGKSPIYEPGIEEIIQRNSHKGRLNFTTDFKSALDGAEVIFIAVGTPSDDQGRADLRFVKNVASDLGNHLAALKPAHQVVVVNKSTVPVGTGNMVGQLIEKSYSGSFVVVSNPEFLREGSAVNDFMSPDRIVIGTGNGNAEAKRIMDRLYSPLRAPILFTDLETAELIKYASNAMLATQISFINSVAEIAEVVGADVTKVAKGMRLDPRIGQKAFLDAGVGYGGSCFPKDVQALIQIAHDQGVHFEILEATEATNKKQRQLLAAKVLDQLPDPTNCTIGIWGLTFKPKTDDMREAPSLAVIRYLREAGLKIRAYDPMATKIAPEIPESVELCPSALEAARDADLLLVLTDWDEFRQTDLKKIIEAMRKPVVVDGRNIYNRAEMKRLGINYISVGRPAVLAQVAETK